MKNKVLIKLIVPTLMSEYEIFIPVNERVSRIKELIIKVLIELTDNKIDSSKNYSLINPYTGYIYENKNIIRDLDIKNSKSLILY